VKPTLLFYKPFSPRSQKFLLSRLQPTYEIIEPESYTEPDLLKVIHKADVILGNGIPRRMVDAAKRLKLVQAPGTGVDDFDMAPLRERSIAVANSHSSAPFVAEHVIAMLLSLVKKITVHDKLIREGIWFYPTGKPEEDILFSDSLIGATVGFLGFGSIGRKTCELLNGFRITPLAHVRNPERYTMKNGCSSSLKFVDIETLFQQSDALIISLPLTAETRGMVNATLLRMLKPAAYLTSVARADVIVEEDLIRALKERWFRGAAVDIWYEGSKKEISKSAFMDNLILSPHRADTHRDFAPHLLDVVDNLLEFARTGRVMNRVDWDAGY
jgi:phosphoglycerate dehydrogenase-like enzyme